MQTLILAKDYREALKYIRFMGFRRGTTRIAARASSIRGIRAAEVHVTVGFMARRDRHPVLSELRYSRIPECYFADVEALFEPAPEVDEPVKIRPEDKPRPDDSVGETLRAAFEAAPQVSETLGAGDPPEAVVTDVRKGRQRRYRCDVCEQLVWSDEDPAHVVDAHEDPSGGL